MQMKFDLSLQSRGGESSSQRSSVIDLPRVVNGMLPFMNRFQRPAILRALYAKSACLCHSANATQADHGNDDRTCFR